MPRSAAQQLETLINQLQRQRQEHEQAIAGIEEVFARFGISAQTRSRPGRPSKAAAAQSQPAAPARKRRRRRRKFATSGLESILAFVKAGGAKGRTTGEINKNWKAEGRSGSAYTQLGELVKSKKLKKQEMPGQRGSRYTAA